MSFDKKKFLEFIIDNAFQLYEEPIELRSGQKSHIYINFRNLDAYCMKKLSHFIIEFTKELRLNPETFYGVPEGATKIGLITQYEWASLHGLKGRNMDHPKIDFS